MNKQLRTVLALMLALVLWYGHANADDAIVGTVLRVKQPARVNITPLKEGDPVHRTDTINTGNGGRVKVQFKDGTVLTVGDASQITVDDYVYAEADNSLKKAAFRLAEGSFRMITSEVVDRNPEAFAVYTPLASIGIRGTSFWGGYLSDIEFDIVMLEGKGVSVTSMGGTVTLEQAGEGVTLPDPQKHPQGYAKALEKPSIKKWSAAKLDKAQATVDFGEDF